MFLCFWNVTSLMCIYVFLRFLACFFVLVESFLLQSLSSDLLQKKSGPATLPSPRHCVCTIASRGVAYECFSSSLSERRARYYVKEQRSVVSGTAHSICRIHDASCEMSVCVPAHSIDAPSYWRRSLTASLWGIWSRVGLGSIFADPIQSNCCLLIVVKPG